MDEPGAGQLGYHPSVVHFSRRAAIRSDLLLSGNEEAIKMAPYHEDYSHMPATQARAHVDRVLGKIGGILMEANESYDDSARLTFESLENALRSSTVRRACFLHHRVLNIRIRRSE